LTRADLAARDGDRAGGARPTHGGTADDSTSSSSTARLEPSLPRPRPVAVSNPLSQSVSPIRIDVGVRHRQARGEGGRGAQFVALTNPRGLPSNLRCGRCLRRAAMLTPQGVGTACGSHQRPGQGPAISGLHRGSGGWPVLRRRDPWRQGTLWSPSLVVRQRGATGHPSTEPRPADTGTRTERSGDG
jgi:hypothetical protein